MAISLSPQEWSKAFLSQARDDLQAARILSENQGPPSVLAMLFQMFFEKIAKAALARTDTQCFIANLTSHAAASDLIKMIKNNGHYLKLRHTWKEILPVVEALEKLHPAITKQGPHLEYPWEAGNKVLIPSALSIVQELVDPIGRKGPKLMRFANELSNRFDEIFA